MAQVSWPRAQTATSGVPNLSLTMYPFSISIDERVPLKCLVTKRLRKIRKSTEFLIKLSDFYNYEGDIH